MGQEHSRPGKYWRKMKNRKQKPEQPDLSLQAARTQIDESASAATQSQDEELHAEQHAEQHEEQYQSTSKVTGLPLDIIVMIFDLLEIQDAVAFSLACKGLHDHLFADTLALLKNSYRSDKLKVQTMLEKDLPYDQIYCYFCRAFHTIDEDYQKTKCAGKDKRHISSFATYVPGAKTSTLSYLEARSIMNAHLFKRSSEGWSLKWLDRRLQSGTVDNIWYQSWKPKVIGGELFLQVSASHTQPNTTGDKGEFLYNVCGHVQIHARFPHLWVRRSESIRICVYSNGKKASGTCATCPTDWKLLMKWIGGEEGSSARAGWDIFILSWHRLGNLRSPSNPLWIVCAGEDRSPTNEWVEGDSVHIIDHDGWDHQYFRSLPTTEDCGPVERMWINAEEREV